ncbi:peptidoglycan editing factor PgeF [Pelotalea chapellei]|uniref:Purine nucleoside phosphorylase n=1 Tax=Pelotalea chapellei TaxID=44671 RepID=A0ABS5U4M5_9BACT|nr:peptidoglycan editing factor PgeF [Pelotalea chapellei]MBT1070620.1 peptidoglycan editing factor PgeF [Pelotalea chapellei]
MQIKRNGRIHYLATEFSGTPCSVQGFTTRHEGVSRPPYNSLNLGTTTLDQQHNVEGNRSLLTRAFGIAQEALVTVRQVHGNDILVIDEPNEDFTHFLSVEGDAIVTNQPNIMIGICVADCAPILLVDPEKKVIAAVHAGWQGTASKLVSKTVAAMQNIFGCTPGTIQAAIGPCISPCCYEVDAPVKQAFQQGDVAWDTCTEPNGEGKWRLDLAEANRRLLISAGIKASSIQVSEMCVSCQRELFFSYRRDDGVTGRQMGFIMLK